MGECEAPEIGRKAGRSDAKELLCRRKGPRGLGLAWFRARTRTLDMRAQDSLQARRWLREYAHGLIEMVDEIETGL